MAPWGGTNVIMLDVAPETRIARIEAAGHDFTVEEKDVHLRHDEEGTRQPETTFPRLKGWKALTRSDTVDVLAAATRSSKTSSATSFSRR
jgi:hypothetical protein